MLTRIITSAVGLAIFFFVVLLNNTVVFTAAVSVLIIGMLWEMFHTMKLPGPLWAAGYAGAAIIGYGLYTGNVEIATVIDILLFLVMGIVMHGRRTYKTVFSTAFTAWFITYFMMTLVWTMDEYGQYVLILPFLCAWITDTGAYFSGTYLGKHKLIPGVSPKKTVEGAVGGIISCVIGVYLYILIIDGIFSAGISDMYPLWLIGVMAALASVLSQVGDLSASAIKRDCKAKDFGNIFPGHGGILDRFDSVLFTAPFIYYFFTYVMSMAIK